MCISTLLQIRNISALHRIFLFIPVATVCTCQIVKADFFSSSKKWEALWKSASYFPSVCKRKQDIKRKERKTPFNLRMMMKLEWGLWQEANQWRLPFNLLLSIVQSTVQHENHQSEG
jgi:hypothetical protein